MTIRFVYFIISDRSSTLTDGRNIRNYVTSQRFSLFYYYSKLISYFNSEGTNQIYDGIQSKQFNSRVDIKCWVLVIYNFQDTSLSQFHNIYKE